MCHESTIITETLFITTIVLKVADKLKSEQYLSFFVNRGYKIGVYIGNAIWMETRKKIVSVGLLKK